MTDALRKQVFKALERLPDRQVRELLRLAHARAKGSRPVKGSKRLSSLRESPAFGMWKDREDIGDTVEFAERLRDDVWRRGK